MLTVQDVEKIKDKIDTAKQRKARAEGALEKIQSEMKTQFNVTTIAQAETAREEIDAAIKKDEARLATLLTKLDGITDWSQV